MRGLRRRSREYEIDSVGPKQGTGLGSFLLVRLAEVARARGDRAMSLTTAEMMDHLIRLYSSHGFDIVHRGPPDHGRDPHTRVTMVKPL